MPVTFHEFEHRGNQNVSNGSSSKGTLIVSTLCLGGSTAKIVKRVAAAVT
jgi:hypothetical protein